MSPRGCSLRETEHCCGEGQNRLQSRKQTHHVRKLTKKNHTEESEPLLAKLPVNAHSSCVMLVEVKIGHTTFKCSLGYDYY